MSGQDVRAGQLKSWRWRESSIPDPAGTHFTPELPKDHKAAAHGDPPPSLRLADCCGPRTARGGKEARDLAGRRAQHLGGTLAFVIGREFKPWQAEA